MRPVELADIGDLRRVLDTNLVAVTEITKQVRVCMYVCVCASARHLSCVGRTARHALQFLPALRRFGPGRIVNVGSVAAFVYPPLMAAYGGSKWALEVLTAVTRADVAPQDISVRVVRACFDCASGLLDLLLLLLLLLLTTKDVGVV